MGVVLAGLCVGVRKGFVTMTVFLHAEGRHLLFPFRTEDWKADRGLVVKIPFGDFNYVLPCSEKWSSKQIKAIQKMKFPLALPGNA